MGYCCYGSQSFSSKSESVNTAEICFRLNFAGRMPQKSLRNIVFFNSTSIIGIVANGNMTTGRIHAAEASATSSANYNYTQRSNPDFSQSFTATPDSMYIWVSFYAADESTQASISAFLHGNCDFQDPNDKNDQSLWAKAAEASAQEILAQWDGTEDNFAALAEEYSTDGGSASNGGLYENVFPGQMVSTFNDWCFDASRQTGDSDIVRTEYGYHIMYFVGQSDVTYRDYMIRNELAETDMTNWYNALVETVPVETIDTSSVSTGLILTPNTSN